MSESLLDEDGNVPNSMSSLSQELSIVGGSTSAAGEKTFITGFSERLPSITFNGLKELTHITTLGTPQRLEVDSTQFTSPNPAPASHHAQSQVVTNQAAPGWMISSNHPSTVVGSVSPSGRVTVSDIPSQDAGNKAGGDALPSLTDASTSDRTWILLKNITKDMRP
ncbi:uncharacterized protein P174DRAFT_430711 [Aspergillus novofumigatus IBT 16806]|uniref:Uncharacterized protein n=1 Tax=Aspergillus novofumigatus (strain IBT 16806) TaxID=1392255 RepID=A0A2I1C801_ASPN1|nr:uncharacterized protein P174DRAFT_430711 [Aspergillus novofumigatus IBT 16806]PKX93721.1 hypothetical protein P174DRAFT_430711 [Aspergillus novofumigatus IBT 16806]